MYQCESVKRYMKTTIEVLSIRYAFTIHANAMSLIFHYFVSQIVNSVIKTLLWRVKRLKELSEAIVKLYGSTTKVTSTVECCDLPFASLRYNDLFENWVRNVELLQPIICRHTYY